MLYEDRLKVLEIYQEGILSGIATFETETPSWEAWDMKFLKFSRFVLVNETEEIIGWCALQAVSDRECYRGVAEVSIYIATAEQSKGFGSLLLKKLILDSEEHEIWTLQAGIFSENKASIALHQKMGFRMVGYREKIAQQNGIWKNVELLERRSRLVNYQ